MRKRLFDEVNLRYDEQFTHAEDFILWTQIAEHAKIANLSEPLLFYRRHDQSNSSQHRIRQLQVTAVAASNWVKKRGGALTPQDIVDLHLLHFESATDKLAWALHALKTSVSILRCSPPGSRYWLAGKLLEFFRGRLGTPLCESKRRWCSVRSNNCPEQCAMTNYDEAARWLHKRT